MQGPEREREDVGGEKTRRQIKSINDNVRNIIIDGGRLECIWFSNGYDKIQIESFHAMARNEINRQRKLVPSSSAVVFPSAIGLCTYKINLFSYIYTL